MLAHPNTYNTFKTNNDVSKNNELYHDNNLIMLNAIEIAKSKNNYNAFTLKLTKDPNFPSSIDKFKSNLSNHGFYRRYDVAEVLRGDYSKLFFDIDAHIDEEEEAIRAFNQINEIVKILNGDNKICRLCGIIEYNENVDKKYIDEINDMFNVDEGIVAEFVDVEPCNNIYVIDNINLISKSISAHLFVSGCYFSRESLQQLFKSFNSAVKLQNSDFARVFDFTVYKSKQQILRFCLSGKGINGRPPNPNFDNAFCSKIVASLNDFVATKTESDTVLICGELLEILKTFINSKKFTETKNPELLKRIKNKREGIDGDLKEKKPKIPLNPQRLWYFNLCQKIAYDVITKPQLTDAELFDKYDVEDEYYYSNSKQTHVRNTSALTTAIKEVMENGPYKIYKAMNKNFKMSKCDKKDIFKFTFEQFKNIVSYGVNIQTLAILINGTFCFFNRSDPYKRGDTFIAYVNSDNEITVDNIKRLITTLTNIKFKIRLNRTVEGVNFNIFITLDEAFGYCQTYLNTLYDFDICCNEPNVLNLYDKPSKADKVELSDEWKTIVEAFATEKNEEFENVVNYDKYEFILDWFAFVLQHPESRNRTFLFISGNQGIGKNIMSNAISDFLGSSFAIPNVGIESVCGNFNGLTVNKKLCVINELENSQYSDKIKSLCSEDKMSVNEKYGAQYIGINKCNFVIFSNHFNTNIIQKGDRRFAYICSTATAEDKSFYASMFNGDELREDLRENLITHLLSRDLSNYSNNEAPLFDKDKIYEDMDLKRSPVYLETIEIMKKRQNEPIELKELVEELHMRQEESEDLNCINITIRTLRKILSFNDTDDYKIMRKNGQSGLYVVYRYKEGSKTAKQTIIDYMTNNNIEKLELNEAIKILNDENMKGITVRTIRKSLNFTDMDEYELKRTNAGRYIVRKV